MDFLRTAKSITFISVFLLFQNCGTSVNPAAVQKEPAHDYYTVSDFKTVEKYDSHVHVDTEDSGFIKQAQEDNFKLITINWDDVNDPPPMEEQQKIALQQIKAFPGRINYATTFSIRNFNDSNWEKSTISYLKNSFQTGAVAVK